MVANDQTINLAVDLFWVCIIYLFETYFVGAVTLYFEAQCLVLGVICGLKWVCQRQTAIRFVVRNSLIYGINMFGRVSDRYYFPPRKRVPEVKITVFPGIKMVCGWQLNQNHGKSER